MEGIKNKFNSKRTMILGFVFLFIIASVGGYFLYKNDLKAKTLEKMAITFHEVKEIEYGTKDFDVKKELVKEVKEAKLTKTPKLDTSKIGEVTLKFNLKKSDVTKEVEYKIKVVDTKAPEITLETDSKELTVGDTYDIKSNVKNVKDVIDGDIQEVEKKEGIENGYYIEGQIDNKKVGEYKVKVIAFDKHGLKAEKDFTVNIKEKKVEKPVVNDGGASGSSSGSSNASGGTIKRGSKQDVVNTALAQIGKPYTYGGRGPDSFDCDGLILYAYKQNGYSMNHSSAKSGYSIGTNMYNAQIGDIIVTPNHVSMISKVNTLDYLIDNMEAKFFTIVEASNPSMGIRENVHFPYLIRADGTYLSLGGGLGNPNWSDIRRVR